MREKQAVLKQPPWVPAAQRSKREGAGKEGAGRDVEALCGPKAAG